MTGKMSWANLNEYVLSDIFDLLASTRDLYHCSLTCRHWHRGGSKKGRKWQTSSFLLTLSCRFAVSMRNDRSWKRRLCRRFRISPHSSSIPPGRTNWRSEYRRLTRSSPSVLSQVRPMCLRTHSSWLAKDDPWLRDAAFWLCFYRRKHVHHMLVYVSVPAKRSSLGCVK